ncbi:twin-arginine translocase TatA/TatE family subunit [Streptomyces sp. NPDC004327]|uniref:twin-arginine translocase TatA/TatE family subunit n=1 Tax=Streptomyces sp. NPDC004327 TaxID=3364699 RepID=UPI0036D1605D
MFGLSEIAILLIIAIVVLGPKKLPDLARSAGKSARILKSEARAAKDAEDTEGVEPRATYQVRPTPPGQDPERTS